MPDPTHSDSESESESEPTDAIYQHLTDEGLLRQVRWAQNAGFGGDRNHLKVHNEPGDHEMAHSDATGDALVSNGDLGVDCIHLTEGSGFVPHTHPGDHILIPIMGQSTITYDGAVYQAGPGTVYIIEGDVPHAVGAITDCKILAVGSPHAPVDSDERMQPVEYDEVTQDADELHCLICEIRVSEDTYLHSTDCDHCPCYECVGSAD